ncbi:Vasculin-like protein 1 [Ophiophagus hannah]|uniref:Vasculin n=1 Tax=Ophiophagus hannah TaxID=8665 RepID=V8PFT3_OPHHA|nr:Vasculin-like protein 1 [Ophiophagus hannah]
MKLIVDGITLLMDWILIVAIQMEGIQEEKKEMVGVHKAEMEQKTQTIEQDIIMEVHVLAPGAFSLEKAKDHRKTKHLNPSLNPEHEREPNQNKSLAEGVWEYPLNPKSRSPRMLIIKKGNTKDLQISGFPVGGNIHSSQLVGNGTGLNVYKGLAPKPIIPPAKITQWKSQTKENKTGPSFPHDSAYGSGNFSALKPTAKPVGSQKSVKECNRSNSLSPVDKLGQPRLTKLTRTRSDKKSEFLKMLKRDPVEEHDENCVEQEKDDDDDDEFNLHNSNNGHQGRDVNRNFENDSPQQMIQSSAFPQTDVLSSSLEAEHRENDDTCAPLTEDEMREFQIISEQLQKNGLRKNCILKNGLICDFKFNPWKNSTFRAMLENEDTETSSSDTSDDDA